VLQVEIAETPQQMRVGLKRRLELPVERLAGAPYDITDPHRHGVGCEAEKMSRRAADGCPLFITATARS
jgi:hypothetical protein